MKKTFEQILEIDQIVGRIYKKEPSLKESKFGYAYTRYYAKNYKPATEEYFNEIETLKINNSLEDTATHALVPNEKSPTGFNINKEGLIKFNADVIKLNKEFYEKEFDIIPFISSMIPDGLTDEDKELLTGIII